MKGTLGTMSDHRMLRRHRIRPWHYLIFHLNYFKGFDDLKLFKDLYVIVFNNKLSMIFLFITTETLF